MNFALLWQLFLMAMGFSAQMEALQPDGEADSLTAGLPPAYVTWRDGRQFLVGIIVRRMK